jgi:hypothetical protein
MYNKPITQRVAYARSKKASALKQTEKPGVEETTVLNKDPMATLQTRETIPGQETTKIVETGPSEKYEGPLATGEKAKKWAKQKEYCKGKPKGTPGCSGFHKYQGGGTEKITTKDPDQEIIEETPLYGYDKGDVDYTWQQRSRGRQALEGARKSGKIARKGYEGMSDADRAASLGIDTKKEGWEKLYKDKGIKNRRQFGKAKKAYESAKASKSYDAYIESQREASEQGISQGSKRRAKVTTPERGKYLQELNKADVETMSTSEQKTLNAQNQKNKNDENKAAAAVNAAGNQDAVDKRNTADKNVKSAAAMKVGPLKMKSSFKMSGFGSKTYKK